MLKLFSLGVLLYLGMPAYAQNKTHDVPDAKILASGRQYFTKGDAKHGKEYFLKIIEELQSTGNKEAEIIVWEELSGLIPVRDTTGITTIDCLKRMTSLHQQLHNSEKEIEVLKKIADVHLH